MHSFGDNSGSCGISGGKTGWGAGRGEPAEPLCIRRRGTAAGSVGARTVREGDSVEISLGEREYAEEDAKKVLLEAGGKLADLIRGNNLSLQEVREDLHLVGWLEEEGIRVRWTPEDAEWIQTDGTVLNEECPEKGIQTELTASLQAGYSAGSTGFRSSYIRRFGRSSRKKRQVLSGC